MIGPVALARGLRTHLLLDRWRHVMLKQGEVKMAALSDQEILLQHLALLGTRPEAIGADAEHLERSVFRLIRMTIEAAK